jgi:hypothetical protein
MRERKIEPSRTGFVAGVTRMILMTVLFVSLQHHQDTHAMVKYRIGG